MADYTAETEWFGDGDDVILSADYKLRPGSGLPGCCRFYVLRPTSLLLSAILPDARVCQVSSYLTVANHGSASLTIKDTSGTTITTVDIGHAATVWLQANATSAGVWVVIDSTSVLGTSLVSAREPIDIVISESNAEGIDLRQWAMSLGYTSTITPYAVRVTVLPGVTLGSQSPNAAALGTGTWPVGSTILLVLSEGSTISGAGGDGGNGGSASGAILPQNGADGGVGLLVEWNTSLFNYGRIQGGGGGGGGVSASNPIPGGGGGGGAGYTPGDGGLAGAEISGLQSQSHGSAGSLLGGGYPGGFISTTQGFGGAPAMPGLASGGLGGAAGEAIMVLSTVTLTKFVAGTIVGAEVVI
jgi:hypothetical protein